VIPEKIDSRNTVSPWVRLLSINLAVPSHDVTALIERESCNWIRR